MKKMPFFNKHFLKLKDFVKKCKSANYCKVIKGLLDKIQENSSVYVEEVIKDDKYLLLYKIGNALYCYKNFVIRIKY